MIKLFFWGMLISFAGSLPLGTMNVAATQISIRDGAAAALAYALGSMLIELIYVALILTGMAWIYQRLTLFRVLSWLTVTMLLAMGIGSLLAGLHQSGLGSSLPGIARYHFAYGMLISLVNPLHLPFWFGWTSFLVTRKALVPGRYAHLMYLAGIGTGTLAGFVLFIYGGHFLVSLLKQKQYLIDYTVALALILTALFQLKKLAAHKTVKFIS